MTFLGEALISNDVEVLTVADIIRRPSFFSDALCREHPEVEFFADRGENTDPAKEVCRCCLVVDECREYAIEERITHGIWGGLSPRQRTHLRRDAA